MVLPSVHEHGMSPHLPRSLFISFISTLQFLAYRCCMSFVKFISKHFIFFGEIINGIVLMISVSTCSWSECRNILDLYMFVLHAAILMSSKTKFCCLLGLVWFGFGSTVAVQLPSCVSLFVTSWTAAYQASLSLTISQSLLKFMSIASVMPSSSALNLSQHERLFRWVGCLHQMTKILEFQLQHQPFQWVFRVDFP